MLIKAFILTFNESDSIEFTIKHYQKFCSEIHIYDNHSTDNTRQICADMGCKIHIFGKPGILDDREYLEIKNNCWKDHKEANLVIICDADEILYDIMGNAIQKDNLLLNSTIYKCIGYNIYSETMPIHSWDEKRFGYADHMYNKAIMFNPKIIEEISYGFGAHGAKPKIKQGSTYSISTSLLLHHMRYIGGPERMIKRYELYKSRMCEFNKTNKLGHQYFKTPAEIYKDWEYVKIKSKEL